MTLYSVYVRESEAPTVVADRFSWFAALVPPVYALVHGLWLLLVGWVVATLAIGVLAALLGGKAAFWAYVLLATFIGFEAGTFRRVRLGRTGWRYRSEVIAPDEDLAMVEAVKRQ